MGAWGKEAHQCFSKLASHLAAHGCVPKSMATFELYARLNISMMRGEGGGRCYLGPRLCSYFLVSYYCGC